MSRFKQRFALVIAILAAVFTVTGLAASGANATTGTCLGTQNPVSGPVSCGGVFLPGMGPSPSTTVSTFSLTLTAASDFWNAPITFAPYSSNAKTQDFTPYERCSYSPPVTVVNPALIVGRTETNPCGSYGASTGSPVLNAASNQPEFATEITPLGHHLGGVINSNANLCISENGVHDGPLHNGFHVLRWHMVERTCDTNGALFVAGVDDGPLGTGITGIVVNGVNPWQIFSAIPTSAGLGGVLLANDILSNNFHNTLYVVDDRGAGYPNGNAIVYPETDGKNQVAEFLGCNGAVIATGLSNDCP